MKNRVILLFLFVLGSVSLFSIELDPTEYRVKIGDVFTVQNAMLDSTTAMVPVLASGSVSLSPLEIEVHVQGKTLENAVKLIKEAIYKNAQITHVYVDLFSIAPSRISLNGAVVYSGNHIFENTMTLFEVSKLPRGMLPSASRKISITRNGNTNVYDLRKYIEDGDESNNPMIYDGDIITYKYARDFAKVHVYSDTSCVIEYFELDTPYTVNDVKKSLESRYMYTDFDNASLIRGNTSKTVKGDLKLQVGDEIYFGTLTKYVYVNGQVYKPDRFPFESGRNAQFYVSRAGGANLNGSQKRIYILKNDGSKIKYEGQPILPGDTVVVPETWLYAARQYLYALVSCATLYNVFIK